MKEESMSSSDQTIKKRTMPRRPGSIALGRFLGIPVFVDFSWLLVFVLISFTISQDFALKHPEWSGGKYWVAGIITSLLFFTCVFLHEMGHSLVARGFGIPVMSITLFIFGGVAHIKREPSKPMHEFLIAIAGPLTSIALAGLFFLGLAVFATYVPAAGEGLSMPASICFWLGSINLMLAIFNMVPGFPLDGGRVLRSIVWGVTGRFDRATRIAASIGALIAYGLIALGIFLAIGMQLLLNGIWIAFIGGFLLMAARSSVAQLSARQILAGLRVGDVMERLPHRVSPGLSVQSLVEGPILHQGLNTFLVEADGMLRGLITLNEVKSTPQDEWPSTPLQSIMVPLRDLVVVEPNVPLERLRETMDERGLDQLPVVDNDQVVGMVSREGLARVLHNRAELFRR
jgi:Zn-dependent protease/CBS domain-containing protein